VGKRIVKSLFIPSFHTILSPCTIECLSYNFKTLELHLIVLNGIHDPSKEASRGGPAEHEREGAVSECEWVSECYVCYHHACTPAPNECVPCAASLHRKCAVCRKG
jgi:hypothetical protein